jgi:RND family efflux transporter MFP subunit
MSLLRFSFPVLLVGLVCAGQAAQSTRAPFDGLVLPFKEVVVGSPVQTTIDAVHVKEGDRVELGQPLAQLNARIEQLDMERAKVALEKKEFDFKSAKNLFSEKIVSEDEALKNRIELEQAKLALEIATEVYQMRTLKAPVSGIVVEKLREAGESVTASQAVFRIVDLSRVYVQFYIRAEDLPLITVGDEMSVRCPVLDAEKIHVGTVDFIDPRVDAASGLLRVKVLLPNPTGEIKAGVRAEVGLMKKA